MNIKHKISTKTFFKPVKRNRYIPVTSCHHDPWLINIPKEQFIRLGRNCSNKEVIAKQAKMIGRRFTERGYNEDFITEKKEEVSRIEREDLIKDKPRSEENKYDLPIILNYDLQFKQVEKPFKKHWSILRAEKTT